MFQFRPGIFVNTETSVYSTQFSFSLLHLENVFPPSCQVHSLSSFRMMRTVWRVNIYVNIHGGTL